MKALIGGYAHFRHGDTFAFQWLWDTLRGEPFIGTLIIIGGGGLLIPLRKWSPGMKQCLAIPHGLALQMNNVNSL